VVRSGGECIAGNHLQRERTKNKTTVKRNAFNPLQLEHKKSPQNATCSSRRSRDGGLRGSECFPVVRTGAVLFDGGCRVTAAIAWQRGRAAAPERIH